jgi:hypothetical protein
MRPIVPPIADAQPAWQPFLIVNGDLNPLRWAGADTESIGVTCDHLPFHRVVDVNIPLLLGGLDFPPWRFQSRGDRRLRDLFLFWISFFHGFPPEVKKCLPANFLQTLAGEERNESKATGFLERSIGKLMFSVNWSRKFIQNPSFPRFSGQAWRGQADAQGTGRTAHGKGSLAWLVFP